MYKRRIKIFMALIAAVFAVILARLWRLQIVEGREYRRRADAALRSVELLPARRGDVLDRRGEILAVDRQCYEFCLDYRLLAGDERWAARQRRRIAGQEDVSLGRAERIFDQRLETTRRLALEAGELSPEGLDKRIERIVSRIRAIRRQVGGDIREEFQHHAVLTGLDEATAAWLKASLPVMVGASVRPAYEQIGRAHV